MNEATLQRGGEQPRPWAERLRFPALETPVPQHEEWCEVFVEGGWRRVGFHDYGEIYRHPGLYEHLFYERLDCDSPRRVVELLARVRRETGSREPLRALDLGAGNGMVGEALREIGAERVVGIDILPGAREAAQRDRPRAYTEYIVADLCDPPAHVVDRMRDARYNALVCVAALGFGDIPPLAYFHALGFLPKAGLLAFNIKEEFLDDTYRHGFAELLRRMVKARAVRVEATWRYCHRRSVTGERLYYLAVVATKLAEVPRSMLVER
jgi:predicted TPR repeat methyltransferase